MASPLSAPPTLRLGAGTTLARYVLPRRVADFRQQHPAVVVTLHAANSEQVAGALLRGELALGFVAGPAQLPGLRYERLLFGELVAVRGATPTGPPAPPWPWPTRWPAIAGRCVRPPPAVATALQAPGGALADLPAARHFSDNELLKAHLLVMPGALGFLARRALVAGQLAEVPVRSRYLARQLAAAWRTDEALPAVTQQFMEVFGVGYVGY